MASRMLGAVDRHNKTQNVDIWARQIATPEAHRAQNAAQNIYILSFVCRSTAPSIRGAIFRAILIPLPGGISIFGTS